MSYNVPPGGDINRLPKWAQKYIAGLKREIENQDKHIAETANEHPGSPIVIGDYHRPSRTLPPDSQIWFYVEDGNKHERPDHFNIHPDRNNPKRLDVTAYGGVIIIRPRISNGISLEIGRF